MEWLRCEKSWPRPSGICSEFCTPRWEDFKHAHPPFQNLPLCHLTSCLKASWERQERTPVWRCICAGKGHVVGTWKDSHIHQSKLFNNCSPVRNKNALEATRQWFLSARKSNSNPLPAYFYLKCRVVCLGAGEGDALKLENMAGRRESFS